MYTLDKMQFGQFVAQLRKEKGMTQKELAGLLYISDKAVSKWERGLSIPDVSLLVPLAEQLGVSVTELLECRRVDLGGMTPGQIEELVKKAVALSDPEPERRLHKRNLRLWLAGMAIAAAELTGLLMIEEAAQVLTGGLGLVMVLCGVFSGFFWLYIREKLPRYYDENRISAFSDGPLRMNLPGMSFNNRNWPYILQYIRATQNSIGSNVETLYQILDSKAEALEFVIREKSPVVGIALKDLKIKSNLLIGCINRKGRIIIPRGNDSMLAGDTVIVVTTQKGLDDIRDILLR